MSNHHRHVTPGHGTRQRLAVAKVTHDLGVGTDLSVAVEVGFLQHPQKQAICLETDHNWCLNVGPLVGDEWDDLSIGLRPICIATPCSQ
jgi:hypothetical protein